MASTWPIHPTHGLTDAEREQVWRTVHARGYRDEEVWSVTRDPGMRARMVKRLSGLAAHGRLLLPGCGSVTLLQEELLQGCPGVEELVCTDFAGAIEVASAHLQHPRVVWAAWDSTRLHERWSSHFDVVMPVNSVLSDSDAINRAMIRSFHEVLRPGGHLLGLFPCIHAVHELYRFIPESARGEVAQREAVDAHERTCTWFPGDPELPHALPQIFYTINDLRVILDEAGFDLSTLHISIDMLSDAPSRPLVERWYHIEDRRVCLWNLQIEIMKPV